MKSNFQERRVGCCAERVATTRSPEPFDGGWPCMMMCMMRAVNIFVLKESVKNQSSGCMLLLSVVGTGLALCPLDFEGKHS